MNALHGCANSRRTLNDLPAELILMVTTDLKNREDNCRDLWSLAHTCRRLWIILREEVRQQCFSHLRIPSTKALDLLYTPRYTYGFQKYINTLSIEESKADLSLPTTDWHKEIVCLLLDCTSLQKLVYGADPIIQDKMPVVCLQQLVKTLSLVKNRLRELHLRFRIPFMPPKNLVDLQLREFPNVTKLTIPVTMFTQGRQLHTKTGPQSLDNEVLNMHPEWIIGRDLYPPNLSNLGLEFHSLGETSRETTWKDDLAREQFHYRLYVVLCEGLLNEQMPHGLTRLRLLYLGKPGIRPTRQEFQRLQMAGRISGVEVTRPTPGKHGS